MDIFSNLALGFQTALSLQNLLYAFGGAVLLMIILAVLGVRRRWRSRSRRSRPRNGFGAR